MQLSCSFFLLLVVEFVFLFGLIQNLVNVNTVVTLHRTYEVAVLFFPEASAQSRFYGTRSLYEGILTEVDVVDAVSYSTLYGLCFGYALYVSQRLGQLVGLLFANDAGANQFFHFFQGTIAFLVNFREGYE